MKSEFTGSISAIRAVEDSIRATRKYTEGVVTLRKAHPVQGMGFPSRSFCKFYEVYPDTELSWDMSVDEAINWLWKDVPCMEVTFSYDYRVNRASVTVRDGAEAVKKLAQSIPGFSEALAYAIAGKPPVVKVQDTVVGSPVLQTKP